MRRSHYLACLLTSSAVILASTAPAAERVPLFEFFSATWCGPCIVAANNIEPVIDAFGDDFIVLENFLGGGRYNTPHGVNRGGGFYGVTGIPTAWGDGTAQIVGSQSTASYFQSVQNRLDVPTDVTVDISVQPDPVFTNVLDVTTTIGIDAGGVAKDLRVYVVDALDHYGSFDAGGSPPRNVLRQVVTDGVEFSLLPGQTHQITSSVVFDNDSMSAQENIRLIGWAEAQGSSGPNPIYNATQFQPFAGLPGDFNGDSVVDAADYTVWRDNLGATDESSIMNNGDGGSVGQSDYSLWRDNYGTQLSTPASQETTPVPEPAAWALCLLPGYFLLSRAAPFARS